MKQNTLVKIGDRFSHFEKSRVPPLSDRLSVKNCCDGGLVIIESFYGSAMNELCGQMQVLIENAQSRYSNRTVTLIEHSPKILQ